MYPHDRTIQDLLLEIKALVPLMEKMLPIVPIVPRVQQRLSVWDRDLCQDIAVLLTVEMVEVFPNGKPKFAHIASIRHTKPEYSEQYFRILRTMAEKVSAFTPNPIAFTVDCVSWVVNEKTSGVTITHNKHQSK